MFLESERQTQTHICTRLDWAVGDTKVLNDATETARDKGEDSVFLGGEK